MEYSPREPLRNKAISSPGPQLASKEWQRLHNCTHPHAGPSATEIPIAPAPRCSVLAGQGWGDRLPLTDFVGPCAGRDSCRQARQGPRAQVQGQRGLTAPQTRAVLKAARDHRLYALYVLALCLGLRRGELLELRWTDVDLEAGKLEVIQSLQRVAGRLQFIRPKTSDSERTVPLPPIYAEALREHRRKQFAERSDRWEEWTEHGLVSPHAAALR
ncbi:site-specific integrase [Nonomuraea mesophila]|uniref:site-specific integrase n=1 Tax=Nonomuraea mesophila TaxID=2530382 RepID=UPI002482E78D|nr:site-specific integrase [Nonomuraea mesophila]